jgi:hypothetical protein
MGLSLLQRTEMMENLYAVFAFSAFLLLASAALMLSHVRAWRKQRQADLEEAEFHYRRRQFRRRMQTSGMIGVLAVALPLGSALTFWSGSALFALFFLLFLTLVVVWVCLLAIVDVWSTKRHFDRFRNKDLLEQTKLRAELRMFETAKNDGKK